MTQDDWPAVASIYADGLATGAATFETAVPSWEEWDSAHLPAPRLVAESSEGVCGWIALARVSARGCYSGVVEHSVYVAPQKAPLPPASSAPSTAQTARHQTIRSGRAAG